MENRILNKDFFLNSSIIFLAGTLANLEPLLGNAIIATNMHAALAGIFRGKIKPTFQELDAGQNSVFYLLFHWGWVKIPIIIIPTITKCAVQNQGCLLINE
jgi:hypothetical protein